jgi:hypothetical protein
MLQKLLHKNSLQEFRYSRFFTQLLTLFQGVSGFILNFTKYKHKAQTKKTVTVHSTKCVKMKTINYGVVLGT